MARRRSALLDAIREAEKPPVAKVPASKPRFGVRELVDVGTQERTASRLNRLGKEPAGVNFADGVTGREARLVKAAVASTKKLRTPRRPGR